MQVEVFSDVVCPWCYIGKRHLERALETFPHATDVTVTYRSFQLDPSTPEGVTGTQAERLAEKYGIPLERAEAMNQRVADTAAGDGLDFRLDEARPANTFRAHELIHFAAEHGKQAQMKERLLAAHFTRGEDVGDVETLVGIAEELGLDADAARLAVTTDAYAAQVREDLSLAGSFGINSVPFFVIDRTYGVAGAQSAEVLTQTLEAAWAKTHPLTMVAAPAASQEDAADGCADGACAVPQSR